MPVNAKARDMNNTNMRPPIQCYKCNGPHKANECPQKAQAGQPVVMDVGDLIITKIIHIGTTTHCQ